MKKRVILWFCVLLFFGTMIGKTDSQAAAGVPGGYSMYASYEGYDFYRNANSDTVCFDSEGNQVINEFKCDGTYTYFFQADGTAMRDRLSYHPDGAHVIYFDSEGHEVFSDFAHVKQSIAGTPVDDYCFFNVYGYMYVDVLTYDKTGTYLYYANPYGVMEMGKWFQFSNHVKWADGTPGTGIANKYGYATENGTLMVSQWTYNWNGQLVYLQGNGTVATDTIFDGIYYYIVDENDGHLLNVVTEPPAVQSKPQKPTAKYTYSLRTLNQYDIYTDDTVILFLQTDNPSLWEGDSKSATFRMIYDGDDMWNEVGPLYNDVKYLDNTYRTNVWKAVESRTGYIKNISFEQPGTKTVVIQEQVDEKWIDVDTITVNVKDKATAEDAWYNSVIASQTNAGMTDYEKMAALKRYVLENFVYDANDGTYLVFLTTGVGPWWEVKEIDCWDATAIMCEFADRLGLESEWTYSGYLNHYYATVYIDGEGYSFDASPYSDTNIVTDWDYVLE